jgi:hypothetical protein
MPVLRDEDSTLYELMPIIHSSVTANGVSDSRETAAGYPIRMLEQLSSV